MNKLTRIVLPGLALAMAALGVYHVQQSSQSASPSGPPESPSRTPYAHALAGSGMVEAPTENIAIGTALSGLVLEVYVSGSKVGQRVQAGAPLFRIDDRHLKAQLAIAEAQLLSAQTGLARLQQLPRAEELPASFAKVQAAQARVVLCQDQYERGKELLKKSAIPREDFVARQQAYETAVHDRAKAQAEYDLLKAGAWKPDLAIAEASLKEAQSRVEQCRTELARAVVRAPVDGVVLQVNIRPGERISELDSKPLMVLGGAGAFHVRIDIDERDIPRYRPGAPAKAYPRGDSSRELALRFVRVEPLVVPKKALTGESSERVDTRVLQVIYAIDPGQPPVYVGQQLDVFVQVKE